VIDHGTSIAAAEGLVAAGVSAVVNASASISGRYPNLGPLILVEAGIPLLDHVGPLLMEKVHEGDVVRLSGDRLFIGETLAAVGILQSHASVLRDMEQAQDAWDSGSSFAGTPGTWRKSATCSSAVQAAELATISPVVLVVVQGYSYREDLAALRAYIRDIRPVLVGVDGSADALLDEATFPISRRTWTACRMRALPGAEASRRRPPRARAPRVHGRARAGRRPGRLGVPYTTVGLQAPAGRRVPAGTREASGAHRRRGHARQPREFLDRDGRDEQHVPRPSANG
jgi:hypothetical protein